MSSFLCENELQASSPQSLIEFGLSQGFIESVPVLKQLVNFLEGQGADVFEFAQGATSQASLYRRALLGVLEVHQNKQQLVLWLHQKMAALGAQSIQREVVREEVRQSRMKRPKMNFVTVKGGSFLIPALLLLGDEVDFGGIPPWALIPVEVPYDFEVLSTPVTQSMWVSVMGTMPVKTNFEGPLLNAAPVETFVDKDGLIQVASDYPVTDVTFASIADFANRLSREKDLPEAYEHLAFSGSSEEGTATLSGAGMKGQFREIQGYRLLSTVEWAIMMLGPHRELNRLSVQSQKQRLHNWGWFSGNSSGILHPVGQKLPFLFDGSPVYDLVGLVSEINHGVQIDEKEKIYGDTVLATILNPNMSVFMRGGDVICKALNAESVQPSEFARADTLCTSQNNNWARNYWGFRLARTLGSIKKKRNR